MTKEFQVSAILFLMLNEILCEVCFKYFFCFMWYRKKKKQENNFFFPKLRSDFFF